MKLLLLEDDDRMRRAFGNHLAAEGHAVDAVATIAQARAAVAEVAYDCLVLDRMVPDGDAVDLVAEIDPQPGRPLVLMISGLGDGDHRMEGLIAGADDYVPKPVSLEELALRVRKMMIRTEPKGGPQTLGRVTITREHRNVTLDGARVHLTPTQYELLEHLVSRHDTVVTKAELLAHCWEAHERMIGNPLHSHMTRLRSIFRGALVFESVWGTGYILRVVPST